MFGLIISGRPVDAAPATISPTQSAFTIPLTPNAPFGHIVVFLLPGTQLPPDTAATVYIQIPPSADFKLLGAIGTGKESAIFKISHPHSGVPNGNAMGGEGNIVVGLSVEPVPQVEAQLATLSAGTSTALVPAGGGGGAAAGRVETKVLAQRIIGNAFNFLASFGSDVVPLKAFQDWWTKFEKRVELDPSFLERVEGG